MKMRLTMVRLLLACWFCCGLGARIFAETFEFHHENVLGTSMHLLIECETELYASQIESWTLEEVARLDHILSRYRPNSELRQLSWSRGDRWFLSAELAEVLEHSEHWRIMSQGAFDVRASAIEQLWKSSIEQSRAPTSQERQQTVQALAKVPYSIDGRWLQCEQSIPTCPTLDGIAKGFILDQLAVRAKKRFSSLMGISINIGGDVRSVGEISLAIEIEDPFLAAEGSLPVRTVQLQRPMGVATSGGYRRFQNLQGQRVSHLFDPRTGFPVDQLASVTVVAPTALQADAIATSISVLGGTEGIQFAEQFEDTACLIIDRTGEALESTRWRSLVVETGRSAQEPTPQRLVAYPNSSNPAGLHVWFELAKVGGGSYRRPYVAVWLEDSDGFPVKTAVLWMQTEQPGPRWHRDLTRWYRNDKIRKLAEKSDLIGTLSGATRGPGEYEAHFDGTDNAGKALAPGKYTLLIETARENGTYQLIREPIAWGDEATARRELKGNVEISKVAFEFSPAKANSKP